MKHTMSHHSITDFSTPSPLLRRLYQVVKATLCPGMTYRFFLGFYLNSKPHCIQVTFMQHQNRDIGFFTCSYSFQPLIDRQPVICRIAIGILSEFHGGSMPFGALCRRLIGYKLLHPQRTVYMVAYLANPLVYATIAKYTGEYWPSRVKATPDFINKLKDNILEAGNLKRNEVRPHVLRIHFEVQFSAALQKRIYESCNPDVKFYLQLNPDFLKQMGVMTIVPVRWSNIAVNTWKVMIYKPLKKMLHRIGGVPQKGTKYKQNSITFTTEIKK
jgi:hypothetical protein